MRGKTIKLVAIPLVWIGVLSGAGVAWSIFSPLGSPGIQETERSEGPNSPVDVDLVIHFNPEEMDLPKEWPRNSFQPAVDQAKLLGHADILVRGHADPDWALKAFEKAGLETGDLVRQHGAEEGVYTWVPTGEVLDLAETSKVVNLIREQEAAAKREYNSAGFWVDELQQISLKRAQAVREAFVDYAKSKGLELDEKQIRVLGVGILEPVVPHPKTEDDHEQNTRVEFSVIKIEPETVSDVE